jgi:hypothetical protein
MKSISTPVAIAVAVVSWAGLALAADDVAKNAEGVRRDSTNLKQLLAEVRKVLPAGWRAEITPDLPHDLVHTWAMDKACLVIWREEEVLVRYAGAGAPIRTGNDDWQYEKKRIYFHWAMMDFLTPQQYRETEAENDRLKGIRLAFENQMHVAGFAKGERPVPPIFFQPVTEDQKEQVRQYTILWSQTEPRRLPTHYYKTISLFTDFFDHYEAINSKVEDEFRQVRDAVAKLITAYKQEAN